MGYIDETAEEGRTVERLIRFMKAVENPSWMIDLVEDMNNKVNTYENLEELCIKETTWGLRMLIQKWKEFFRDIQELYEYRELGEQGKLLKLPCIIGDKVYVKMQFGGYAEAEVRDYSYFISCGFCVVVTSDKFDKQSIPFSEFGKTIFLACPDGGNVN